MKKYKTEDEKLRAIREDEDNIRYIHNPSVEVQLKAVRENGYTIEHIHNPSEKIQLEAVKKNGYAIQYIHNLSEKVIREFLISKTFQEDPYLLHEEWLEGKSDELKLLYEVSKS